MIVLATPHRRYDRVDEALRRNDIAFTRLRSPDELTPGLLASLKPRYVFFPHWSWKVPADVYNAYECVIFHMTDVPFGRGGSPLQNLIVRGHADTMLAALRCDENMDSGPVYLKRPLTLDGTAEEILTRAAALMVEMIVTIVRTEPDPVPQRGDPTVFKRRRPEDGDISGLDDLGKIYDYIRMLDGEGYTPAFVETEHFRFEFTRAVTDAAEVHAEVRIVRKLS